MGKMKKSKTPIKNVVKPHVSIIPKEIQAEAANMLRNGLTESLLGFNPGSIGTELNQVDTLFKNNRWYFISNMQQLVSQVYPEHGLIQTIVDVPVDDALRGGIDIKTKLLEEDDIELLQTTMEREDDLNIAGQSGKWNRLFGGAGIIILDGNDSEQPFKVEDVNEGDPLEFKAVDMWELFHDKQNTEGFTLDTAGNEFEFFNYYGKKLHKSRVLLLKGLTAPSFVRPRLRGWGLSVLEPLVNSINQYLKANNLSFEVLDEFKLDIFKIKNLTSSMLTPGAGAKLQERVMTANRQKNYLNALTMDSEDDYMQKQLSFTGLAETMAQIRMQVASDMRMPLSKLFGISATGFNSGEDDIEVYNSMIESQVRAKLKFHILKMVQLRCKQLFGEVPEDLSISFKPLRILSAEQEENVKTAKFARLLQNYQAGMMTSKEYKEACNRDDLLPVQLDTSIDVIESEPMNDSGQPGADKEDNEQAGTDSETAPSKVPVPSKVAKTAPEVKNSLEFDKASYEAEGGDDLYGDGKEYTMSNPRQLDVALWAKATEASQKAYGKLNWKFRAWYYRRNGGVF